MDVVEAAFKNNKEDYIIMFEALNIAYYTIAYSNIICRKSINNFKLNKLLYCIQKAHLKQYDAPFFDDDIVIYGLGPAIPNVWLEFCYLGGKSLPINYHRVENIFSIKDNNFIDEVIDKYIDIDNCKWFEIFDCNNLNTVWGQIYNQGKGLFEVIPLELIKEEQEFVFDE